MQVVKASDVPRAFDENISLSENKQVSNEILKNASFETDKTLYHFPLLLTQKSRSLAATVHRVTAFYESRSPHRQRCHPGIQNNGSILKLGLKPKENDIWYLFFVKDTNAILSPTCIRDWWACSSIRTGCGMVCTTTSLEKSKAATWHRMPVTYFNSIRDWKRMPVNNQRQHVDSTDRGFSGKKIARLHGLSPTNKEHWDWNVGLYCLLRSWMGFVLLRAISYSTEMRRGLSKYTRIECRFRIRSSYWNSEHACDSNKSNRYPTTCWETALKVVKT